jgi:Uma2 family endonuclease
MAEARATGWTVTDLEALPYDEWHRYELIGGELFVTTAPRFEHQGACTQLAIALGNWSEQSGLGQVFVGPGLVFTDLDSVIPDLIWISHARFAAVADDKGHFRGAPELVVEVLSPGAANLRRDTELKRALYDAAGVEEYWVVDWRARTVAVYRRATGALRLVATLGGDEALTSPVLPGFVLPVARLFASAR